MYYPGHDATDTRHPQPLSPEQGQLIRALTGAYAKTQARAHVQSLPRCLALFSNRRHHLYKSSRLLQHAGNVHIHLTMHRGTAVASVIVRLEGKRKSTLGDESSTGCKSARWHRAC